MSGIAGTRRLGARAGLVVIAASAGGIPPLIEVVEHLPPALGVAIVVVVHRTAQRPFRLAHVLARHTSWPVVWAVDGAVLEAGTIYVVPHDLHARIGAGRVMTLSDGERIDGVLSSANILLETAAKAYGPRLAAVVLSGMQSDASAGVRAVHGDGGLVIVQDPGTAEQASMPRHAIATGAADVVLAPSAIAEAITRFAGGWRTPPPAPSP